MDRIKRLSYDVLDKHKSKFGESFSDNKKVLGEVSIIRSKGLKNEIAGYITKFIKKEIRDMKTKQARIDTAHANEMAEQAAAKAVAQEEQAVEGMEPVEVSETEQVVEGMDVEKPATEEQTAQEADPVEVSETEQVVEGMDVEKPATEEQTAQEADPVEVSNTAGEESKPSEATAKTQ